MIWAGSGTGVVGRRCRSVRRLISTMTAGAVFAGSAMVAGAGTAAAQVAPTPACTEFSNDKVWQTSTKWGRARERTCVESIAGSGVRGVVQFQVDWPVDCSVSVGFPPSASGGCPLSRSVKEPGLWLKTLSMSWNWEPPGAAPTPVTCNSTDMFFGNMVQGYKPVTVSCHSPWSPITPGGSYVIDVVSVEADVKDDGDPPRQLTPYTQTWTERSGDFNWETVKA